ncbi:TPA: YfdX family protein [Escherichia coli]|uniref:YfdX family protein n=1 Tax=Escherichia coli TaxID=562 RepID=UPI000BDF551D|nr:YfdX family protein [Escherichia coli]EHK4286689.1 YfdX family protein [Escherichia coli]EKH2437684.1 YfdX family protein [Escherichia coli]ELR3368226.1 YfdX family protein [Escherichia coli]HAG7092704.1 YfdX family protein [Escherichia coli]HAL9906734.1 YfdX family protein [Escherichia coli]
MCRNLDCDNNGFNILIRQYWIYQLTRRANRRMEEGKQGAIETLHLAGIDVAETQLLMPLKQTIAKVDKAREMLDDGKCYEANLAPKGAEDGIITDTETIIDK